MVGFVARMTTVLSLRAHQPLRHNSRKNVENQNSEGHLLSNQLTAVVRARYSVGQQDPSPVREALTGVCRCTHEQIEQSVAISVAHHPCLGH